MLINTAIEISAPAPPEPCAIAAPVVLSTRKAEKVPSKHLPALTGLRFVLALWVVVHHLTGRGMMLEGVASSLPSAAASLFRGGWVAVQTFFVLSGLVLARTYGKTVWCRQTARRYAMARLARVYPGYLLSLAVVSPFAYYTLVSGIGKNWAPEHKMALLLNYGAVWQGWTGSLGVGWNTPAWSLSCEFFFYLCFPLLALALGRDVLTRTALALTAALLLPPILFAAGVPESWKPLHHLADFLMGIAAAGLVDRVRWSWLHIPATCLFAGIVAFPASVEKILFLNTALRPASALVLISLASARGLVFRALASRAVQFLGQASYALYILHVPLLWWFTRYCVADYFHLSPARAALLFLSGAMVISAAAFHFVEEPANNAIRRLIG